MKKNPHISIVIPVFGAPSLLNELVDRIIKTVKKIDENFEIILVDDCDPDNSWSIIENLCKTDLRIIGIKHSRNFGQQYAINCGLDHAQGDWVVTLDCDLQDSPEEIINLYKKGLEGNDIVIVLRKKRQDDFLKKLFSKLFYKLLSYLTDTFQDPSVGNFVLYKQKAVNALKSIDGYYKYYPLMIKFVGFKILKVEVQHAKRKDGVKSSYDFDKRFNLALDVLVSFSNKLLRFSIKLGLWIILLTMVSTIFLVILYFTSNVVVRGWASIILLIWFMLGIVIFILGIFGLYIEKIFESVKGKPPYIVDKYINYKNN